MWDLDRWRLFEGCQFLNYTTKFCRDFVINRISGTTRVVDECKGCLMRDCQFYWSKMWDLACFSVEVAFMWLIWHKVVMVNEWRARIAQPPFPNSV